MSKLRLKRESIRDLSATEQRRAMGGNQTIDCSFQVSICQVGCLNTDFNCVSGPCHTLPNLQN